MPWVDQARSSEADPGRRNEGIQPEKLLAIQGARLNEMEEYLAAIRNNHNHQRDADRRQPQ